MIRASSDSRRRVRRRRSGTFAPSRSLSFARTEANRHQLMHDAVERGGIAFDAPPEVLEEADVRELHVGDHAPAAKQAPCAHRESNELRAEMMIPVLRRHR